MDVHVKSDDQLTTILTGLNEIREANDSRWGALDKTLADQFDVVKARIEILENKTTNTTGQRTYVSPNGEPESRREALCHWMNALYNRRYGFGYDERAFEYEERADQANAANKGDTLVPDPLAAEIVRIIQDNGVVRRQFRNIPMTADVLNIPSKTSGPSVSVIGEGSTITASSIVFGKITLTAAKLAAVDEFTFELEQDSLIPLASVLVDLFGEAMAAKEDNLCLQGTSPWTGIFKDTGITAVALSGTNMNTVTYDKIVDLVHTPDVNVQPNGVFMLHPNFLAELRKLKDTTNNPIWAPMAVGEPATILGRPYVTAAQAPVGNGSTVPLCVYGDFKKYAALGLRNDYSVAFSGEVGFLTATRHMRVMERIAYATLSTGGFGRLTTL